MKKANPWTIGIILIFGFFIFVWNDYEFPFHPFTDTSEVQAKISDIEWVPVEGGHGFLQKITYFYFIGDKQYVDIKKIGRKYKKQHIGNRVLIEYSIENPDKTKIIGFFGDYKNEIEEVYFSYFESGYYQITLLNGLFNEFEYGKNGVLFSEKKGEYKRIQDTLSLDYFNPKLKNKKLSVLISENNRTELIEMRTGIIYR